MRLNERVPNLGDSADGPQNNHRTGMGRDIKRLAKQGIRINRFSINEHA